MQPQNPNLEELLATTACSFRCGQEGMANNVMTVMIDCLGPKLPLMPADALQQMTPLLEEIMAAVSRKDFSRAADLLEYRLLPLVAEK